MYDRFGLFLNGAWRSAAGGRQIDVVNPATEEVVGRIPHAEISDLDTALESALKMQPKWAATPGWERSRILRKIAVLLSGMTEDAARMMALECGKPMAEARGEFQAAIDQFDWYADEARRI